MAHPDEKKHKIQIPHTRVGGKVVPFPTTAFLTLFSRLLQLAWWPCP